MAKFSLAVKLYLKTLKANFAPQDGPMYVLITLKTDQLNVAGEVFDPSLARKKIIKKVYC